MTRLLAFTRGAACAIAVCLPALALAQSTGTAQPSATETPAQHTPDLPVTRVVLFTSGVGYFEHEGTVEGSARVDLTVGTDDMNDVLQSLVLQDLDGGSIRTVGYPSRDPLGRILQSYALDLTGNPSLAELLAQARGERVHVEATQPLDGTIVNVEQTVTAEDETKTFLTLSTPRGLVRVPLDEVRALQFADPAVQADLEAALDALASYRNDDDRSLHLAFDGSGTRRVRIGYVREMPVWKTTYRLLVNGDGTADLQGWAIFDNPTAMDLEDVQVTFVAGQPISFVTNLYPPVYVERPRVDVSTAPPLAPPAYADEFAPAAPARSAAATEESDAAFEAPSAGMALQDAGVTAMAEGVQTGATFQYRVAEPVTVGRHASAMIPIVQATVPAADVSVYDASVFADNPLRGLRIVNDSGLHLAAGPVSVFDDGGFTGNARIADIVPGGERLLTYAVDLEIDVARSSATQPQRVTAVTIDQGVLVAEQRQRVVTEYRIDASNDAPRMLIVEHPKREGFDIVAPSPAPAETPQSYRFGVATGADGSDAAVPVHLRCEPGASCVLEVVAERVDERRIAIANVTPDEILTYLENVELDDEDRRVLGEILDLKQRIAAVERDIARVEMQLHEIEREQDRIRQNMAALDRDSSLYRRYVADLEAQEDEIDTLQERLEGLRDQRGELQELLDEQIRSLSSGAGAGG